MGPIRVIGRYIWVALVAIPGSQKGDWLIYLGPIMVNSEWSLYLRPCKGEMSLYLGPRTVIGCFYLVPMQVIGRYNWVP